MQKQESLQSNRIKPLTIKTPLYYDESISSWLIRAALNQGCDILTFTQFYWPDYRLWTYDVDKGFNHIDGQVHKDMAILADMHYRAFNSKTLMSFAERMGLSDSSKQISIPWTQPLTKRNRRALLGYQYCPLCMHSDKEARLKLSWRFTWTLYCVQHQIRLQSTCTQCEQPYQPQLLEANMRYINHCHSCKSKLAQATDNQSSYLLDDYSYKFQRMASQVYVDGFGYALGKKTPMQDWFELMSFYVNIVRRAVSKPDYMFGKLLNSFGINTATITPPKTGLRLDQLPIDERIELLGFAIRLNDIDVSTWIRKCEEMHVTQNSFNWSKGMLIPEAFKPIYEQLPFTKVQERKSNKNLNTPRAPESVMKLWERLKRKTEMRELYDQDRLNYKE